MKRASRVRSLSKGAIEMTKEEKLRVDALRRKGMGYGAIAGELGLSVNTVKSYCRRHALPDGTACEACGAPIVQVAGRKRKRFCSDACRNAWWNAHLGLVQRRAVRTVICAGCGRPFEAYGRAPRKYCSHACYVAHRFGGHHG